MYATSWAFQASGVLRHAPGVQPGARRKVYAAPHEGARERGGAWDLVNNRGAYMFICGGTGMGTDVQAALADVLSSHGRLSTAKAEVHLSTEADGLCRGVWVRESKRTFKRGGVSS